MSEKEKMNILAVNLKEILSNFIDAKELLSNNEKTKLYYEEYEKFLEEYRKDVSFEQMIKFEDVMMNYSQGIGISAFFLGFNLAMKLSKGIEKNEFITQLLDLI